MDLVRLGYVGCGMMAQRVHLPNFASIPGCELVGLAEVRQDVGEKVQRRYGIPRLHADHRGLIDDPNVDAIAVSAPTEENLPTWLPAQWGRSYVSYLQQYTHNVNLLRFFLDAGDRVRVKHVDLDPDGYAGTVLLDVDGIRATLETGSLKYYRWDEHTQIYFERGWAHTWAPPLLQRNAVAEVEIYRSDERGAPGPLGERGVQHTLTRPIPEPRWGWAYKREAVHFIESLRTGAPFRSTGDDALSDVRLFEEIFRTWTQV